MLKAIACDLDGTLLLNGAQSLQDDTCGLIEELRQRGILFLAASGRQYPNLRRLFSPVEDRIGYLCDNGCVSFLHGRQLHKRCMDRGLGQEIIRAILGRAGSEVMVSGVMTEYIQPKDARFYYHLRDTVKYDVTLVPDILDTEEEYLKVSLYEREGLWDEAYWQGRFGGRCTVVTSGNEWLDTMPQGVNKGVALKQILDELGIAPCECMAIGDNDNDREMLELAGWPATVRSAKASIRAIARIETDTVEALFRKILRGEV